MNKRKVGTFYETLAASYLKERNIRILSTNYRIKQGEVDLIGEDTSHIIFVEVKYRSSELYGYPEEAVSKGKQRKICLAASHYLMYYPTDKQIRFDVIAISKDQIRWYKNAFFSSYC